MSGIFDEREKGIFAKLKHDEELRFRTESRRDKLLGSWAAELMGLTGEAAEKYATAVVIADIERPGPEDVVEKLLKDFAAKKIEMSEHRIRKQLERFFEEAVRQLAAQGNAD